MKWLVFILFVLALPAAAEVYPHPGPGDPHIQYVGYDPEQVVVLNAAVGFAITVELSPDERIENVALGNAGAWQVQVNHHSDKIFVKPLTSGTATNMTIITDARHYSFILRSANVVDPDSPYSVRFTYPIAATAQKPVLAEKLAAYKISGKKALWPTAMSDDGQFTAIVWATDSAMPAVYKIDANKQETLVNGVVRDGAYVIEGVASKFVFRLGKDVAYASRVVVKDLR
jgi:type IV secretion system protein VirB9